MPDRTVQSIHSKRGSMEEECDKLRKKQRRGLKKNLLIEKQKFRIKGSRPCDQSLKFFKSTTVNEKYQQNNMQ